MADDRTQDLNPLDEAGTPVDWWFIYKVPELSGTAPDGLNYAYYDPVVKEFRASEHRLLEKEAAAQGALDRTLSSIFKSPRPSVGWILYNDEMPADCDKPDVTTLGHTKGLLAFDTATESAIWLLHSWPKFADPYYRSEAPSNVYGQTYLCVSITLDTANRIAELMVNHQQPQVYFPRIPANLDHSSGLYKLSEGADPNPAADSRVMDAKTRMKDTPFKVIAKNRQWNNDFWNNLVAPALMEDMDVDTWIRGPIPSVLASDGVHHIYDIKYIDLTKLGKEGWAWPETRDHAKWGITRANKWVVVGDINRMISQQKRGGGAIALQDEQLWKALQEVDLLIVPPGKSEEDARNIILQTHGKHAPLQKQPPKPRAVKVQPTPGS